MSTVEELNNRLRCPPGGWIRESKNIDNSRIKFKLLTSDKIPLSIFNLNVASRIEKTNYYGKNRGRECDNGQIVVFGVSLLIRAFPNRVPNIHSIVHRGFHVQTKVDARLFVNLPIIIKHMVELLSASVAYRLIGRLCFVVVGNTGAPSHQLLFEINRFLIVLDCWVLFLQLPINDQASLNNALISEINRNNLHLQRELSQIRSVNEFEISVTYDNR